ncbi:hypothetical protein DY000_02048679 [Brassica cretica]|uniref:Uncharacterized protein n=1 Tax=Brassica cretica TaxID=69181 RepID=A0ABQ7F0L1_BRACR|nr:hypothetical protein DY000_02048679 [Brassica cretica]
MPSLDVKKPTEHLPYIAAEVDQITSKLYTAIDTIHAEWLQKEVKAIQRQFASQHQISASIDSKAPASTDKHLVALIDTTSTPDAEQVIQNKMESMHEELNELSAYAYDKIGWHQFSIENTQERLQDISNAIHKMDERWTRNDEATRSFIAAWSRMASLDVKKPTEHLPYTAAEVDQITSKLYTAIDTMEDRFEKRCDDIYFPFDVRLSGLDSHAECKAPASTDKHLVSSIDTTSTPDAEQLIQNIMESMNEELNELSAYAYDKIGWHQFNIENTQEGYRTSQMQYIRWMRDGPEMMRPQEVSLQLGPVCA